MQLSKSLRGLSDKGWFVALASEFGRSEPGGIGFDEHTIDWHFCRDIAEGLGFGVGEIASERNEESEFERASRLLPTPTETVHYTAQAGGSPMFVEDLEEVIPGVVRALFRAAMNENWAFAGRRDLQLSDKPFLLNWMSSTLVVVVEADLAAGDHFRFREECIQLVQGSVLCFGRIVGIDAGAGVELGYARLAIELAADVEGLVHF